MRAEICERIDRLMVQVSRPPYLDITPILARDPEAFDAIVESLASPPIALRHRIASLASSRWGTCSRFQSLVLWVCA